VGPRIWRFVNQIFPSNTYICAPDDSAGCLLVDPGTDPEGIDAALRELGLEPTRILCTHGHFDHAGSAAFFQKRYGAPCHLHEADLQTLRGSNFLTMAFRIPFTVEQPAIEGFEALTQEGWHVYPAPGHTPGSCIFQYGKALFTGDTLYAHGVGLSMLPGEDPALLRRTVLALWNELPAGAFIHPGHGESAPYVEVRKTNKPLLRFLGLEDPPTGKD